jgi:NAD(P)-dependent dehydrogenase (short-subunit alcohol dehydrogenase family)
MPAPQICLFGPEHDYLATTGLPTGRLTTAEEVATLVVLLASKRTANVTGANYVIDGGLIKTT